MAADGQRRTDKELIRASNAFAQENRLLSWWHMWSTLLLIAIGAWLAAQPGPSWQRTFLGVLCGLLTVRGFIIYHDYMHGAILRNSSVARLVLDAFGLLVLTPPKVWAQTHNYHHAHTAKIVGSHVGSFIMMTTEMWAQATPQQRLMYRIRRAPMTIALGYLTVFLYGFCMAAFMRNPQKNKDSAMSIGVHLALLLGIGYAWGGATLFYAFLLPNFVSHALGAYLFYAQHNFPEAHIQPREEWTFVRASLESSSYMRLGPVMRFFTGNIGYHHVHHLNHRIPFYRLPEAMAAIPELQEPRGVTSLAPSDIVACLRLKLWDPQQQRLVPYPDGEEHVALATK